MSSSPPPNTDESLGLSPEELAERELSLLMSSSPPPFPNGEDDSEVDKLALDTPSNTSSADTALTTPRSLQNQLVVARRKATQLKLHPYQRDAVEEFVKGSQEFKQTMLYMQMCVVENQISSMKAAVPLFVSSPQLLENIKSFVVAVLLSSKLRAYKEGSGPITHVMSILTGVPRPYVPDNLASDTYALKVVRRDVSNELTQTRSKIKKFIKESLGETPVESDTIFELATTLVANSKSSVTVPLCARIALLRKVYIESPGTNYWDKVDAQLTLIHTVARGEHWKITRAFEHILQTDRSTHSDNSTYVIPETADVFQNSVDDVCAGTH